MKEGGPSQNEAENGFTVRRGSNSTVSARSTKKIEPFVPFVPDLSSKNFS